MKELDEIMKAVNAAAKMAMWMQDRTELEKFLMLVIASYGMLVAKRSGTIKDGDLNMGAALVGASKGCYEAWDDYQHDGKDYVSVKELLVRISANVAAACTVAKRED